MNFHLLRGIYIPNFRKFHQIFPKIICDGQADGRIYILTVSKVSKATKIKQIGVDYSSIRVFIVFTASVPLPHFSFWRVSVTAYCCILFFQCETFCFYCKFISVTIPKIIGRRTDQTTDRPTKIVWIIEDLSIPKSLYF